MALGNFNPLGAVAGTAIGVSVGGAVSPVIQPLLEDMRHEAWEQHQVRALDPPLAARLVAEGIFSLEQGHAEAKLNGVNGERFALMVAAARNGPSFGELLELHRRNEIDGDMFRRGLEQAGIRREWWPMLGELRRRLLTVDELARMVIRGVIGAGEGADRAGALGLEPATFAEVVAATGNPPANETALELWNRGFVDEGDVDRALQQSDLKAEWFEAYKQLRAHLPPVNDMIRFAVREVYTPAIRSQYGLDDDFPDVFAGEAAQHGLDREQAGNYWAAHWELPSIEQGYRMYQRGLITLDELQTLLRTKDVMPHWRENLIELAYLVPGRVDLRRMFAAGVIDRDEVKAGYQRLGYSPADAETLTVFAEAERRDRATRGSVVPLYRRAVISAVHREYVARQLDDAEARAALEAIAIPDATQADLLELWTLERDLTRRELTIAEIRKAYKKNLYDRPTAHAELLERGVAAADADTLLDTS